MKNDARSTILFSGGGTMGPVTPLLAVVQRLRSSESDVAFAWVGSAEGPEFDVVDAAGIPFFAIPCGKFRRYFSLRNVTDLFRIVAGFFASLVLLRRIRPCVVASAGGFTAVPVVWAAAVLRIPVHVHQQDVIPGLANRLSLPFASSVSVALPSSVADFGEKAVHTGNPVRESVLTGSPDAARERFGVPNDGLPVVLVLGGGIGATGLNALVIEALPMLVGACRILHVTGKGKETEPPEGTAYAQVPFISDGMGDAYALADLVVTRAGMGTLSELSVLGKPAIVVPMPDSHQEANARRFEEAGASRTLEQKSGAQAFAAAVVLLLRDEPARTAMGAAMRAMNPGDAADRIAASLLDGCARPSPKAHEDAE